MLSKMLPPGVAEKHLVHENSRKKDKSPNDERSSKSPVTASRFDTNWEKFRKIVVEQDSTAPRNKQPKRQRSVQTWRDNRKSPRMVPPRDQSRAQTGENVSADPEETKRRAELTKQIAIDCEMVGIGDGVESMLARVSLVNHHGVCVYDKYVKPRETIRDYRTAVSGIRPHHLTNGEDFKIVQSQVSEILRGRLLIGHALKNDLGVLFLSHPKRHLRDTSRYKPFRKVSMGNTPSLKKLAAELLGVDIQSGEHNSIEDARTAMQLYVLYKNQWENDVFSRC